MKDGIVDDTLHQLPKASLRLQCAPFGLPPLGHISGDLYKTQQLAVITLNGIDHSQGPKPRPVFANTPAFAFEVSVSSSHLQCVIGKTPSLVFGGEEVVELPADYFLRLIPLEASGTGFQLTISPLGFSR